MSEPPTHLQLQSLSSNSIPDWSESVPETSQPKTSKRKKMIIVAAVLCCALAAGLAVGIYGIVDHVNKASSMSAVDAYVLPNDRVHVTTVNDSFIAGTFTVKAQVGELHFNFMSDKFAQKIKFGATNPELLTNVVQFKGFEMRAFPTHLFWVLCRVQGVDLPVEISNTTGLNSTAMANLQEFVDSIIATYFVELSVKLGVWNYTGKTSSAARAIHALAKMFVERTVIPVSVLTNETVARANDVVFATQATGKIPDSIAEIQANSGGRRRRRLAYPEHCPSSSPYSNCGNPCFGMCGRDCDCWSWYCGTCNCVNDCHWHDYYCSCESIWNFWCVNVFWISC